MSDDESEPLRGPGVDTTDGIINRGVREPEHLTGCGSTLMCDPRRWAHRYFVLVFMCFLGFGSYFCNDNPAALEDYMKDDLDITTTQYELFYSLYSWPNVILCFFGGFLLDRVFGVCWGTIIFSSIVTLGQVLFALGALFNSFGLMCFARFVFGYSNSLPGTLEPVPPNLLFNVSIGGESLAVAGNSYAVNWFQGRALNMVFGLQLSFARVGSTVNFNVMGRVYDSIDTSYPGYKRLGLTLFVGVAFCVLSLFCAMMMGYFDKRSKRLVSKDSPQSVEADDGGKVINLKDIKDFGTLFWILSIICVAFYVTIFPFISVGKVFFLNKYEMTASSATSVNSVVYIVSAVASPFFGFCIDRIGLNIFWVLAGICITIVCHGLMAFTFLTPWVPMVVLGFGYSILASSLWPMVAMVVERHHIGTAYGIMQSVQNLGLAIVAIIAGVIADKAGYLVLEVFFLICLIVALIATVLLYMLDAARGGKLNMSAWNRRAAEAARARYQATDNEVTT